MKSQVGEQGRFPALPLGQHSHLHTPSSTTSQTLKAELAELPAATSLHWVSGTWLTAAKVILKGDFKHGFIFSIFIYWRGFSPRLLWRSSSHLWNFLPGSSRSCLLQHITCKPLQHCWTASFLPIYLWWPWNIRQNPLHARYARTSAFYQCCVLFPLPFLLACDGVVKSLGQELQMSSVFLQLWDECSAGPQLRPRYAAATPHLCSRIHMLDNLHPSKSIPPWN